MSARSNPPAAADSSADLDEAYCPACSQSFAVTTTTCPSDGAKLILFKATEDPFIGRVLDQRYQVRSPLGRGGMGTVYRAWQLSVDREVALKVVHGKLTADRTASKRFLREARLASRLSQPNIVNVYDFGQTDDGVLYLVMELLRGRTLQVELAGGRRLPPKRVLTIAMQLCDALEAAHAQNIIHRDLKPGNMVILDEPPGRDLLKVLDFGLAKSLLSDSSSNVTNTDAILGTPLYMSPESVQGLPADHRSDLYAVGCILYEALAGTAPFVDSSINLVMAKHMTEAPPPLPPFVPTSMRVLIERLLAKAPADRPQSAAEVRAALAEIQESGVTNGLTNGPTDRHDTIPDTESLMAMSRLGIAATITPAPRSAAAPVETMLGAPAPRRRWVLPAVGAAAVGAGVVAFALTRGSTTPSTPPKPAALPAAVTVDAARAAAPPPDARPTPDAAPPRPDATPAAKPTGPKKPPGTKKPPGDKPPGDKPPPDIGFLPTGS